MYVEEAVLDEAAELILGAISDGLPTDEAVEAYGWDKDQAEALEAVLDGLTRGGLMGALRDAAARLPEPEYDDATEGESAEAVAG